MTKSHTKITSAGHPAQSKQLIRHEEAKEVTTMLPLLVKQEI